MIITPLHPGDTKALWDLEQEIWTSDNTPNLDSKPSYVEFSRTLADARMLIAREEDEILGFISYDFPTSLSSQKKQWAIEIGVAASAQGRGVGTKLMEAVLAKAEEEGIKKLSLRVMGTNHGAIRFYKRFGFAEEAHYLREFWIQDRWVDDYQLAYYID